MTDEYLAAKLAELEQRSKACNRRLEALEEDKGLLHRMVSSLEVLAGQQEYMSERVDRIDEKVSGLELAPLNRWRSAVGYAAASLISSGMTYLLTGIFK